MRATSINKPSSYHMEYAQQSSQPVGFLERYYKRAIHQWLSDITIGCLVLEEGGECYTFGDAHSEFAARVTIHSPITYRDLLLNGLVGAGESYMRGAWSSPDLVLAVRILCANLSVMQQAQRGWFSAKQFLANSAHHFFRHNSKKNSRLNIAAHYDLGNDFFSLFLDPSMMYSSAIYPNPEATLAEAATYKLEHICQRLCLNDTDHLLEIGTGWGGMAIYAAKNYGCHVTTTTISKEQYEYAQQAVQREGLADKVTVLFNDYRDLEGQFDKLVSIEMIEAVGHRYYSSYFSACSRLLKADGLMLIQAITVPDQRYEVTKNSTDFIQQYIFPGGELPSVHIINQHLRDDTDLQVVGIDDIALDYAKTLAAWRDGFFEKIDQVRAQGFNDVFIRMWDFYLAYCQGGFRERTISTVQMVMAKPRCQQLPLVTR